MLVENLELVKNTIAGQLKRKEALTPFAAMLLDKIQPNSSLTLFCHKCKTMAKIDFIRYDSNLMMHCTWCEVDITDLDSELYSFVHYNVIKKQGENYGQ